MILPFSPGSKLMFWTNHLFLLSRFQVLDTTTIRTTKRKETRKKKIKKSVKRPAGKRRPSAGSPSSRRRPSPSKGPRGVRRQKRKNKRPHSSRFNRHTKTNNAIKVSFDMNQKQHRMVSKIVAFVSSRAAIEWITLQRQSHPHLHRLHQRLRPNQSSNLHNRLVFVFEPLFRLQGAIHK